MFKNWQSISILLFLLIVLISLSTFAIIRRSKTNRIVLLSPTLLPTQNQKTGYYLQDLTLYQSDQIIAQNVSQFAYDQTSNQLAYLTGPTISPNKNYHYILADTVMLQKNNNVAQKIFTVTTQDASNADVYTISLKNLEFSVDGAELAITSNDAVYLYQNGIVKNIIRTTPSQNVSNRIYSYDNPKFSPDNKKLLVSRRYYEGRDYLIINLISHKATETNMFSYINGNRLEGWLSSSTLVGESFSQENKRVNVFTVNLNNFDQKNIIASFNLFLGDSFYNVSNKSLYLKLKDDQDEPLLTVPIYRINIVSKTVEKITSADLPISEFQ